MIEVLKNIAADNDWLNYLTAAVVAVVLFIVLCSIRSFITRRVLKFAAHTRTYWDDIIFSAISKTSIAILAAVSLLTGLLMLNIKDSINDGLMKGIVILLFLEIGLWGSRIIRMWVMHRNEADTQSGSVTANYEIISYALRLLLWTLVILLVLSNLGINVTTLIASLGIGGVAVALAVQSILGDLFASLSIVMDKPFELGDFLAIDDLSGTVIHIGLKTTRLLSISGEELVFANSDLLDSRIHNYKKMEERRVVYTIGVDNATPPDKLRRVNQIISEIFDDISLGRLDRVHFSAFGAYTNDFEIVYFVRDVKNADYDALMEVQEALNLGIVERFAAEGIGMPLPTQLVQLGRAPKAQPPSPDAGT